MLSSSEGDEVEMVWTCAEQGHTGQRMHGAARQEEKRKSSEEADGIRGISCDDQ